MWHTAWQAVLCLHRNSCKHLDFSLCFSPAPFPSTLQSSSSPADPGNSAVSPGVNLSPPSRQWLCSTDPAWSSLLRGACCLGSLPASLLSPCLQALGESQLGPTGLEISSMLLLPLPCHVGSRTLTSSSSDLPFQIRQVMGRTCWGLPPPPHPFEHRHVGSEAR